MRGFAAKHSRHFGDSALLGERGDGAGCGLLVAPFGDYQMVIGAGCDLGQMGHGQHLSILAEPVHEPAHSFGDCTTDT